MDPLSHQPIEPADRVLTRPLHELPDPLPLPRIKGCFSVRFTPPGSKSLTNRALLLAALADGQSTLKNALLDADDARRMVTALRSLGIQIAVDDERSGLVRVLGGAANFCNGARTVRLDLGNAGTAVRFLAAAALLLVSGCEGVVLDGDARMRERPIGELVDALRYLGATCDYEQRDGFPPVRIAPPPSLDKVPSEITFPTTSSSQFVSALLLAAPFLPRGMVVRFADPLSITSASYIGMTMGLLRRVGVRVDGTLPGPVRVHPASHAGVSPALPAFEYTVEPDASGATYCLAAAAASPGSECIVPGLTRESLQGDVAFVDLLTRMGASASIDEDGIRVRGSERLRPIKADMRDIPDAAMALSALCCLTDPALGPSELTGLRTLRVKETDRLAALRHELGRVGATVEIRASEGDEALVIHPMAQAARDATSIVDFETYHDHRMAMSMALFSTVRRGVRIRNPGCVSKTYPAFWSDWARLVHSAASA